MNAIKTAVIATLIIEILTVSVAQAVSLGHTGGGGGIRSGGGGGGIRSGGGNFSRSFSAPSFSGNRGFYSRDYTPRAVYSGEGYQYSNGGGIATDWVPAVWGGNTSPKVTPTLPPPFALPDPMADYYRQQEIDSQMATINTGTVNSLVPTGMRHLPTDFGNVQGQTGPTDSVVTVEQGAEVRKNFHGSGLFTKPWWKNYKNTWCNPAWPTDWVWNAVDWDTLVAFWRGTAPKSAGDYEFGSNIVLRDGKVYYIGETIISYADFYHQAQVLAARGEHLAVAKKVGAPHKVPLVKDWAQLGVFSLVPVEEKFSTKIIQLAVNRDGKLRGNCYDVMNDQVDRVEGEVDKSNSRVCFTVGKNRAVVYDTGLGNLLSAQSPILIHLDKDHTQQRALVRLDESKL